MSMFTRAKKSSAKLRLAIGGPSGGGKTFTALSVAKGLGGRIALIDTEHASASKYADKFDFDTLNLSEFNPADYIKAIKAAEAEGYDVIVIDSLTHAWEATKDIADAAGQRLKGNTFAGWKDASAIYAKLPAAIIQSKAHVIATIRAKDEYIQDVNPQTGRKEVRKVGLGLQAGKNIEYEFDILLEMEDGGRCVVQKSRYDKLSGKVLQKPGAELGQELAGWLSDGEAPSITPDSNAGVLDLLRPLESASTLVELKAAWLAIQAAHDKGYIPKATYEEMGRTKDSRKADLA